jgi:hypothetical protein
MTPTKQRCMTCQQDYEAGTPEIYSALKEFEGWCICRDCVDVYRKRKPAEKSAEH